MPEAVHFVHGIAAILLTFFGASVGAVVAARQPPARPELAEVLLAPAVAASVLLLSSELNRWLVLGLAVASGTALTLAYRMVTDLSEDDLLKIEHRPNAEDARPEWRRFLLAVGSYQSRLAMSLFYFTIVAPFALIARSSQDPLDLKSCEERDSYWRTRAGDRDDLSRPY